MILEPPLSPERFGYLVPVSKMLSPPFLPASMVKEDCCISFLKKVSSAGTGFSFVEKGLVVSSGFVTAA